MARREFETLTPQMFYILLALKEEMHGYEIMNKVKEISGGDIQIGAGTMYTLLPKFESECYIKLVRTDFNKKVYKITSLGEKKLATEAERRRKEVALYESIYKE